MEHIPLRALDEEETLNGNEEKPSGNFVHFFYSQTQGLGAALILLAILGLPIIIGVLPNFSAVSFRTCMDGNFRISEISSPWDPRTIFAITLGFGSFDFGVAKGIDIAFDLLVGRGGQLLLGLIAYPVFTDVLLYSMESRPARYEYFSAVAFNTVSFCAVNEVCKDLCRRPKGNRNFRITLVSIGLLLASLYVLSFPTLASAATGYITSQDPVVPNVDDQGTTESWPGGFQLCAFLIEDGDRVPGLNSPQCIPDKGDLLYNTTMDYYAFLDNGTFSADGKTNFSDTQLESPALTITQHRGYELNGLYYSNDYLEEHGYCRPNNNKYKWGFSYLLLFVIIILTYVWAAILTAMHVETMTKSQPAKGGRRLGFYRAVLDLSRAIRLEIGEDAQLMPNPELESLLVRAKEGIVYSVPADMPPPKATGCQDDIMISDVIAVPAPIFQRNEA